VARATPTTTIFIELNLLADVEGQKVRLSANAAIAVTMEEHK